MACSSILSASGLPAPRTCEECGLGPCHYPRPLPPLPHEQLDLSEHEPTLNPMPAIPAARIQAAVNQMAWEISYDLNLRQISRAVIAPVLDGASVFCADLMRKIPRPLQYLPIRASSYTGMNQNTSITLELIRPGFENQHVILVDDVLDSGKTLTILRALLRPIVKSLRVGVLVSKRQEGDNEAADHIGLRLPTDRFLVGYGMDYRGWYRNLPDIHLLNH